MFVSCYKPDTARICTIHTLVIPMAPIFSLYEVVPVPVPQAPARMQPIPSIPIPRLIAWAGGGGAPDILAHA